MYGHLKGLRVVEGASFVAAPSGGLYLAQLGAEVIRVDQIGGGPDFRRWPQANGSSLYWEGLNKDKKSVAVDLGKPEGRELLVRLATAPGDNAGILLTNYPGDGFLAHDRLVRHRADQITVRVMGWADGATALDYTINAAVGVPDMTGPQDATGPVNHVLPAWDLLTGSMAAFSLLAAERHRRETGAGGEVRLPLSDVAVTTLANLGQLGEVLATGQDRPRMGNDLFGAFGRDFVTSDGRRLMIVALTARQWRGLVSALGIGAEVEAVEREHGVSFADDEGNRFLYRHRLNPIVASAVSRSAYAELTSAFDASGVCWGPYRTLSEAVAADPRLVSGNPVFSPIRHPSGLDYPAPGFAATMSAQDRRAPVRAPLLGENTEEVLADVLACSSAEIAALHDRGIVASARTGTKAGG